MMQLHFLGTGAGSPSKTRNVSALALKLNGDIWLFDCGEATQHQILKTTIRPASISKIFITHVHGDHIFGLLGLLSSRAFLGGKDLPLNIYAPVGIKEFVETALRISQTQLTYPIAYTEFTNNQILFDDEKFTVSVGLLAHSVPSYGFRIEQKNQMGQLQVEKLRLLGVPEGKLFGQLKKGETVQLPNGLMINGQDFLSPPKKGKIVAILGDTTATSHALPLAQNADVLVHEATFSASMQAQAQQFFHSTTADATKLAKSAHVKKLYLTHISARYDAEQVLLLEQEAQAIFANSTIVHDFDVFDV